MTIPRIPRPALALAAVLVVYSGVFSPISTAAHFGGLGGAARGILGVSALLLLGLGFVFNNRIRFPAFALFGILPYVYLLCLSLRQTQLEGAYNYLHKLAPYLCAGLIWYLLTRTSDRAVFWTILILATLISVRALAVFVFPNFGSQPNELQDTTDSFFVFEYIGAYARVFYPGQALVFLGLALAVRGVIRASGRERAACAFFLVLGSAALIATMIRGLLIIGACLLIVEAIWTLNDARISTNRKLNVVMIGVALATGLLGVLLASGYGDKMLKGVSDVTASERLSLDDRNFVWRQRQADAAFSMMKTDQDWLIGLGPTASVPLAQGTLNELHFGYHSIVWTFGFVGLAILLVGLLHALAGGLYGPRERLYWRENWIAVAFVVLNGGYVPALSIADFAIVLVFSAAYVWAPRPRSGAEERVQPIYGVGPAWPHLAAPPRRWSQMVGGKHAAP